MNVFLPSVSTTPEAVLSSDGRKLYPVCDRIPGVSPNEYKYIMAVRLPYEFRCPKKGEWYLSGAIPGAYRALSDLTGPYYICKLVRVQSKVVTDIVGDAPGGSIQG